jgi:hypothetical protein
MPQLEHPDWEAFAQARARGETVTQAWRSAGGKRSRGDRRRIGRRPPLTRRLAELHLQREALRKAHMEETIEALVAMADGADLTTGVGIREARAARLEAHRLSALLARRHDAETWAPPRPMTEAEWDARYGPDAPAASE